MSEQYKIRSINDMVVTVDGGQGLSMQDMVYLGDKRLIGEVVGVDSEKVTVQVYESTTGLAPGQPVYSTGGPMTIQWGARSSPPAWICPAWMGKRNGTCM